MSHSVAVTGEDRERFENAFDADRANAVALNAVVHNGLFKSAKNFSAVQNISHTFSVQLQQGDITNQKQSGRCWMFAGMNVIRAKIMQERKMKNFELSQAYLFFFDKLEKANYFLENIIETREEPVNGRLVSFLLQDPVGDGGQWDMFCGLVRKYGLVPKSAYPESVSSSASRELNTCLTEKLREDACVLRTKYEEGSGIEQLRELKTDMLEEIYRFLCICLGKPPKTFDFEYRDKDNEFFRDAGLTPLSFFEKYVTIDLADYISIINAPTQDKPFHRSYTVRFLGSVKEGKPVKYLNLPIEDLKRLAAAQMQDGEPVWFGCDVGKRSDRDSGILDTGILSLEPLLNTHFSMTKAQRLDYGHSLMTHAMVLQGVNLDESGRPNRWRVENSWGKDPGCEGYYVMSDEWFDEYLYQIVVHKKYLSPEQLAAFETEPVVLEPWDPMGSLAAAN
ncbi:MAG: C1 family peptidase [Oscillospiraceae bacterium]|nr:C1 family peptidase [Oscillospiraceae bacterium]